MSGIVWHPPKGWHPDVVRGHLAGVLAVAVNLMLSDPHEEADPADGEHLLDALGLVQIGWAIEGDNRIYRSPQGGLFWCPQHSLVVGYENDEHGHRTPSWVPVFTASTGDAGAPDDTH